MSEEPAVKAASLFKEPQGGVHGRLGQEEEYCQDQGTHDKFRRAEEIAALFPEGHFTPAKFELYI